MSFYFLEATAFVKLFVQEAGTNALISLMEGAEDNRKLISASTPLEIYAVIRRRERSGGIDAGRRRVGTLGAADGIGAHGATASEPGGT